MGLTATAKGLTDETGFDCGYITFGYIVKRLHMPTMKKLAGYTKSHIKIFSLKNRKDWRGNL
jgi:hypothetical protein